jgi:hypothetical protein
MVAASQVKATNKASLKESQSGDVTNEFCPPKIADCRKIAGCRSGCCSSRVIGVGFREHGSYSAIREVQI